MDRAVGLEDATRLIHDLLSSIAARREATEEAEVLANQILDDEEHKFSFLSSNHLLEQESNGTSNGHLAGITDYDSSDSDNETLDGYPVNENMTKNIQLRIELQRLQEVDTKSTELLGKYEQALANIFSNVDAYIRDYKLSVDWVAESYKARIDEEMYLYDELKAHHNSLLKKLVELKKRLQAGRDVLDAQMKTASHKWPRGDFVDSFADTK